MRTNPNIETPRRFAIFVPLDYAFALMQRLYPEVGAFRVLEDTQGLIRAHSAVSVLTGLICISVKLPPFAIFKWTIGISLLSLVLRYSGLLCSRVFLSPLVLYSNLTGYGLFLLSIAIFGLIWVGLKGTAAWFMARLLLELMTMLFDQIRGRIFQKKFQISFGERESFEKIQHMLTGMDRAFFAHGPLHLYSLGFDFFQIFSYHATKIGVDSSLVASPFELDPENWEPVWSDYAEKWPELAARYS